MDYKLLDEIEWKNASYSKFQLESTCEDEYEKYKKEIASQHEPSDYRYESLRFHPKGQGLM